MPSARGQSEFRASGAIRGIVWRGVSRKATYLMGQPDHGVLNASSNVFLSHSSKQSCQPTTLKIVKNVPLWQTLLASSLSQVPPPSPPIARAVPLSCPKDVGIRPLLSHQLFFQHLPRVQHVLDAGHLAVNAEVSPYLLEGAWSSNKVETGLK